MAWSNGAWPAKKRGIAGHGLQTQTLPASTLIKGLANREGLLLIGIQPTHGINAPVSGQQQGCCIGQGQQTRATDANGANRLAADQRGFTNAPRLPRSMSPLRLRNGIGGKRPDPRKLGRGFGIVWFCHRGLRPATQLRQPTSQKQASTDADGQSAVFISSGALPPSCCGQKSTPQKQAGHQHNAPGNSVISHLPHSCCWPNQQQSSHC